MPDVSQSGECKSVEQTNRCTSSLLGEMSSGILVPVDLAAFEDLAVEDAFVRSEGEFFHVPDSTTGIV
jgi:hypothetical protein